MRGLPLKLMFCVPFLGTMATLTGANGQSVFRAAEKPRTATISILAISSSIHQGVGNQEIYLADLLVGKEEHQLVKLVDTYPATGDPIPRSTLLKHPALIMRLRRDPECDVTGRSFFLRPGDQNIFDGSTRAQLAQHESDTLSCFRVEHEATRFKK
jgi:hypothetical protein